MAFYAYLPPLHPAPPAHAAGVGWRRGLATVFVLWVLFAGIVRLLPAGDQGSDRVTAVISAARRQVNAYLIDFQRRRVLARLPAGYVAARSPGLTVYHRDGAADEARTVAALVRRHGARLASDLEAPAPRPVTVVITPSRDAMAGFLGARYGANALGAYWRGVIWVLSPREWLSPGSPGWERRFEVEGPVVHELAHQVLDERAAGNLPGWWDEGVAQYTEYRRTGFQWIEAANRLDGETYSLADLMDRFDALPNEALAYRQAFLLVRYLAETSGADVVPRVNDRLAAGQSGRDALAAVTGLAPGRLERAWRAWLAGVDQDVEQDMDQGVEQDSTDGRRSIGAGKSVASAG